MAAQKSSQLGELLVEMGLVERDQLAVALQQQRATGLRLPRILADKKIVDEDRLAKAVSAKLGLEAVNLTSLKIHERVLSIIPASVALKYGALPIAIKRTNQAEFVYVVMADPLDNEALSELQRVSGRQIRVLVAAASELDRALEQHYRSTSSSLKATLVDQPIVSPSGLHRPPTLPPNAPIIQGQPAKNEPPRRAPVQAPPPIPTAVPQVQTKDLAPQPVPPLPVRRTTTTPPHGVPTPGVPSAQARSKVQVPAAQLPPTQPPPPQLPSQSVALTQSSTLSPPLGTPAPNRPSPRAAPPPVLRPTAPPIPPRPAPPPLRPADVPQPSLQNVPPFPLDTDDLRGRPKVVQTGSAPSVPQTIPPFQRPVTMPPLIKSESGVRVPEDKTKIDPDMGFPSPLEEAAAGLAARDWDAAVRDWDRSTTSSPSWFQADPQNEKAGVLGAAAPQAIDRGLVIDDTSNEPVTSAAKLDELGHMLEAEREAAGKDRSGPPSEELHIDIVEPTDGPEDIKTSQVDVGDELLGLALPAQPVSFNERALIGTTLEVPVDVGDIPSPFEGPSLAEVPTGLERTGIIPAIDWEKEEFVPPPLEKKAGEEKALIDSGDIPMNAAQVRARASDTKPIRDLDRRTENGSGEPKLESRFDFLAQERLVLVEPEPIKKRRSDPPIPLRAPDTLEETRQPLVPVAEPKSDLRPPDVGPNPSDVDAPFEVREPTRNERLRLEETPPAPPTEENAAQKAERKLSDEDTIGEQDGQRALDLVEMPDVIAQPTPKLLARSEDSDASDVPVIAPSSLVSLIDEADTAGTREDTGSDASPGKNGEAHDKAGTRLFDEGDRQITRPRPIVPRIAAEEDPTNPRIDTKTVQAALAEEHRTPAFDQLLSRAADLAAQHPIASDKAPTRDDMDRGKLLADLEGMVFGGPTKTDERTTDPPRVESSRAEEGEDEKEAKRMVEALVSGDSLNSPERAELVLAIGRLLLKKGILKVADLVDELKR